VKEQRVLGEGHFVDTVHRPLNEQPPFLYDISLGYIVFEASSALHLPVTLFYALSLNRQVALGRALAG
jgi:hypothetical protein